MPRKVRRLTCAFSRLGRCHLAGLLARTWASLTGVPPEQFT